MVTRAGRPEQPLHATGSLAQFAGELRRAAREADLPRAGCGHGVVDRHTTHSRRREHLPTWKVARDFTAACGGDQATVRRLWEDACAAAGRPVPGCLPPEPPVPAPGEVTSAAQLVDMMRRLRAWAGNPSLATLNERSGGFLHPPSTVSDMLRGHRLPRLVLVSAYVRACGLDGDQAAAWERTWAELNEGGQTQRQPVIPREPVSPRPGANYASAAGTGRSLGHPGGPCRRRLRDCRRGAAVGPGLAGHVTGIGAWLIPALPVAWLAGVWLAGGYDARFAASARKSSARSSPSAAASWRRPRSARGRSMSNCPAGTCLSP